jgi:hypothetical protein
MHLEGHRFESRPRDKLSPDVYPVHFSPSKERLNFKTDHNCFSTHRINHWRLALTKGPNWVGVFSPLHLRMETDPVSETSCFYSIEYRTMGKVKKPSNSVWYTPSSEPFIMYLLPYTFTKIHPSSYCIFSCILVNRCLQSGSWQFQKSLGPNVWFVRTASSQKRLSQPRKVDGTKHWPFLGVKISDSKICSIRQFQKHKLCVTALRDELGLATDT